MVAPVIALHELSAGTKLPLPLLDQRLELLILSAHAAVLFLLAAHAHSLFAQRALGVVFLDETPRDVGETVFPRAIRWIWSVEFL